MSHAIFVRDIGESSDPMPRVLAYVIEEHRLAQRVVRSIVHSYPAGGMNPVTQVYWFRDETGLQELSISPH